MSAFQREVDILKQLIADGFAFVEYQSCGHDKSGQCGCDPMPILYMYDCCDSLPVYGVWDNEAVMKADQS